MRAGAVELLALPGDQLVQRLLRTGFGGQGHLAPLALELVLQPPPVLESLGILSLEGGVIGVRPLGRCDDIAVTLAGLSGREGAVGIDQPGEPQAGNPRRRQRLGAIDPGGRRADQGVVIGEGRADRLGQCAGAAMKRQEPHDLVPAAQHRHACVRPGLADQAREVRTQQRVGEGRIGHAEPAPGLDLAFAQGPGVSDLSLDHESGLR